jgi:hypothetical protein
MSILVSFSSWEGLFISVDDGKFSRGVKYRREVVMTAITKLFCELPVMNCRETPDTGEFQ